MKIALAAMAIAALFFAIACGDGGGQPQAKEEANEAIEITSGAPVAPLAIFREAGISPEVAAAAAAALPGITVLGAAEASAEPDSVLIRLTIGQGEFGPPPGRFQLVEEEELQPVVEALKDAGAPADDIVVNTFASSFFGPYGAGAAQITFTWPRPRDVRDVLDAGEDAVREHTDYSLQNVETLFTLADCEGVEEEAWKAALEDARQRAQRLAQLAEVSLGGVIAISEATVSPFAGFGPLQGCQALRSLPAPFGPPPAVLNSPSRVTVAVALQVTFAIK